MTKSIVTLARNFAMDSVFNDRPYQDDDWDVMCSSYYTDRSAIDGFMPSDAYQGYTNDYVIEAVTQHFNDYIGFADLVIKEVCK